jgi:hypothetical protein
MELCQINGRLFVNCGVWDGTQVHVIFVQSGHGGAGIPMAIAKVVKEKIRVTLGGVSYVVERRREDMLKEYLRPLLFWHARASQCSQHLLPPRPECQCA